MLLCYTLLILLSFPFQEFQKNQNGLLYSDNAIMKLKQNVDSVRSILEDRDIIYPARTVRQSMAIYLHSNSIDQDLKSDMKRGLKPEQLKLKYPDINITDPYLYLKYKSDSMIVYKRYQFDGYGSEYLMPYSRAKIVDTEKETWHIFINSEKEKLTGFYILEGFTSQALPENYARMIQYTTCMIDTNAQVFFDDAYETLAFNDPEETDPIFEFLDYVNLLTDKPPYPEYPETSSEQDVNDFNQEYEKYSEAFTTWDSVRFEIIDQHLLDEKQFQNLFQNALNYAYQNYQSNREFETYVSRYGTMKQALFLKRNRRVYGQCSQDLSPRYHALDIAKLAAETNEWSIFLRAHLDILNDNFSRITDGSYAYAGRQTYLKELEVIDIDIQKLLLGISLRFENESKNHYSGYVSRIGRSFTEFSERTLFEVNIRRMIQDENLDYYNRMILTAVYLSYIYNLENKEEIKSNMEGLFLSLNSLPKTLKKSVVKYIEY